MPYCLKIKKGIFYNCTNLESVKLPDNLKYIEEEMFMFCENLKSINIPNSVLFIKTNAFRNTAIKNINLPLSLNLIGHGAFLNTNINIVYLPSSKNFAMYDNTFDDDVKVVRQGTLYFDYKTFFKDFDTRDKMKLYPANESIDTLIEKLSYKEVNKLISDNTIKNICKGEII